MGAGEIALVAAMLACRPDQFAALGRTLTPDSIHRALVRSEDHYSNIVRAGWRELAVGVDMTDNPDGTPAWIAIAEIFQ